MSETRSTPRSRLKFALAGAVGGALVLLPLGEVWRHQSTELEALADERALLDPLAHALALQHGLIGHRHVADRVLRGRQALEGERRLRHAEVDRQLAALQGTLVAGAWVPALRENNALTKDWRTLVHRIAQHRIGPADSAAGHALLLEQAVQVMDLVSAAAPAGTAAQLAQADAAAQGPERATGPQALAVLQDRISARQAVLQRREAAVREQRSLVHMALAGLAVLAALAGWIARSAGRATPAPSPDGTPNDGIRRSRGRRSTDGTEAHDEPARLLDRLQAQALRDGATVPAPPGHRPGRTD